MVCGHLEEALDEKVGGTGSYTGSVTRLDGTKVSPAQIDATVTRLMEPAHVTGVGIAVWNNNKVVYLKTNGERNTEKASATDSGFSDDRGIIDETCLCHNGHAIGS